MYGDYSSSEELSFHEDEWPFEIGNGFNTEPQAKLGKTEEASEALKALLQGKQLEVQVTTNLLPNEHCYLMTALVKQGGAGLLNYLEAIGQLEEEEDVYSNFTDACLGLDADSLSNAMKIVDTAEKVHKKATNIWLNALGVVYQRDSEVSISLSSQIEASFLKQWEKEIDACSPEPTEELLSEVTGTLDIVGLYGTYRLVDQLWRKSREPKNRERLHSFMELMRSPHGIAAMDGDLPTQQVLIEALLTIDPTQVEGYVPENLVHDVSPPDMTKMIQIRCYLLASWCLVKMKDEAFEDLWMHLNSGQRSKLLDCLTEAPVEWTNELSKAKREHIRTSEFCFRKESTNRPTFGLNVTPNSLLERLTVRKPEQYTPYLASLPALLLSWYPEEQQKHTASLSSFEHLHYAMLKPEYLERHPEVGSELAKLAAPTLFLERLLVQRPDLLERILGAACTHLNALLVAIEAKLQELEKLSSTQKPDLQRIQKLVAEIGAIQKTTSTWLFADSKLREFTAPVAENPLLDLLATLQDVRALEEALLKPKGRLKTARNLLPQVEAEEDCDESAIDFEHPRFRVQARVCEELWHLLKLQKKEGENDWDVLQYVGLKDVEDFKAMTHQGDYLNQAKLAEAWEFLRERGVTTLHEVPKEFRNRLIAYTKEPKWKT